MFCHLTNLFIFGFVFSPKFALPLKVLVVKSGWDWSDYIPYLIIPVLFLLFGCDSKL